VAQMPGKQWGLGGDIVSESSCRGAERGMGEQPNNMCLLAAEKRNRNETAMNQLGMNETN